MSEAHCQGKEQLASYVQSYKRERVHQALGYHTPWEVYVGQARLLA